MTYDKMKTAKSVVFDMETLIIINAAMEERRINFSESVRYLIKNGDYVLKKIKRAREEELLQAELNKLKQQERVI
jgi:hypothetical protein